MRRLTATVLAAAIAAVGLGGAATADEPRATAGAVNMEKVVKAAMWDPYKPNSSITPGAGDSVKRVEKALADKGMLAGKYVDGHFGTSTVEAYAKYQRSLGHSGLDASGLPGKGSLTKLGASGGFDVTRTIDVGGKVTIGSGQVLNRRTLAMIEEAEKRSGIDLTITQGSYTGSNPDSAGTHDGGGAVDISVRGIDATKATKTLRQVGFAAWHRTADQGDWAPHIHAIAISDTAMSPAAQAQAGDYYLGRNGLANHAPDDGPKVEKVTWEEYRRSQ
ncbi:peptidoglycan-binding protein [Saccharomonospora sp. CUA-673]|uniref:peptidoglycan-binding domain-containing protein n=1 Tax=Saccharomonospora sp. CUA-673 TaxID=1904969 RepID=UPI00095B2235|nr:peptidoglycan-binding domain-containing protein [Saccharomonospora sp. CUA-673]OLT46368.1 peptidoglycan-binding protein [Saccharomonospora sp. CUA-673]